MSNTQILMQQLADTALEKKQLEVREKALKEALLEEFKKEKKDKDGIDGVGTFTIARRSSWQYTDAVKKLEEVVKMKKIEEEEKGDAVQNVTEYILFKEAKQK